jgi:hypothetical protein
MTINPWEILFPVAIIALIATAVRIARRPERTTVAAVLGLGFLACCLALNARGIYEAVDPVLGATNVVYLLVQLTFVASMLFMKAALVPHVSSDGTTTQYRRIDVAVVLTAIILITIFFLAASTPISAYRVEPYRSLWQIVVATQIVNVYSVYAAIPIIRETLFKARSSRQTPSVRAGSTLLCIGFSVGVITAVARFVLLIPSMTGNPDLQSSLRTIDGYFVAVTVVFIVAGWACIFIGNRHPTLRRT